MTTINVRQCHPEFRAFFSLKVFSISRYHILQFWKYHLFTVKFHFSILTFCWGVNQKRNHSLLLSRNTPMNFRNWERNEENLENLHMLKIDFKERVNLLYSHLKLLKIWMRSMKNLHHIMNIHTFTFWISDTPQSCNNIVSNLL